MHSPLTQTHTCLRSPADDELDAIVAELFQMSLISLKGYQEIADLAADAELRRFAQSQVRRRHSQCRALTRLSSRPMSHVESCDSRIAGLRRRWLSAVWNLEQEQFPNFAVEMLAAEISLEAALQQAARGVNRCIGELLEALADDVRSSHDYWDTYEDPADSASAGENAGRATVLWG